MKFCPNCGTPRTAKFCAGCGFSFEAGTEYSSSTSAMEAPQSIIYGEDYDPENDCFNCGNPKSKRAKTCSLCDQEFKD